MDEGFHSGRPCTRLTTILLPTKAAENDASGSGSNQHFGVYFMQSVDQHAVHHQSCFLLLDLVSVCTSVMVKDHLSKA